MQRVICTLHKQMQALPLTVQLFICYTRMRGNAEPEGRPPLYDRCQNFVTKCENFPSHGNTRVSQTQIWLTALKFAYICAVVHKLCSSQQRWNRVRIFDP